MGRMYKAHSVRFLDSFSYFLMAPRQFILFDSYRSSWEWYNYWFPVGVSPQCWFDYSPEAEFTDRGLQSLTLQDINAQYVLWY